MSPSLAPGLPPSADRPPTRTPTGGFRTHTLEAATQAPRKQGTLHLSRIAETGVSQDESVAKPSPSVGNSDCTARTQGAGFEVNPRLSRHIIDKLYFDANPEGHEVGHLVRESADWQAAYSSTSIVTTFETTEPIQTSGSSWTVPSSFTRFVKRLP